MPWLAALFSFLLPGGGQLYNRQFIKGALIILGYGTVSSVLGVLIVFTLGLALFLAPVLLLPITVVSMIDGYKVAARLQRGEAVRQWQWF